MNRILRSNIILILALLSTGCFTRPPGEEVQRIASPDGLVDAVLTIVRRSSLNQDSNYVYLVPKGSAIGSEDPNVEIVHQAGLEIEWLEPAVLQLKFRHAEIFSFTNRAYVRLSPDTVDCIEVQLYSDERHWLPERAFKGVFHIR